MPTRKYDQHTIISDELPEIMVIIDERFTYIGTKMFKLSEHIEVELFVFIVAEQDLVQQSLVIHFERVVGQPEHLHHMNIPTQLTHDFDGHMFYTDMRCLPAGFFQNYQDSFDDWAQVYRMIEESGYQPPIKQSHLLLKRFGQIVVDDASAEFLMIYSEPFTNDDQLAATPHNTFYVTDRERHIVKDFDARAIESVSIASMK